MSENAKPNEASKRQEIREQLLRAFETKIEPVPVSMMYRCGFILLGGVMLVLPAAYLLLLLLLGHTVYWHVVYWNQITTAQAIVPLDWSGLQIVATLVLGPIVLFFLIKPLFHRDLKDEGKQQRINESAEPFLFEYVSAVCHSVGSPVPKSIRVNCEVNAAASLRRGFASLTSDDLTLTIGLPLVAGMTVKELTGVLAHEFGHFAQSAGLRASFITVHINYWFQQAVYKQDEWDKRLAKLCNSWKLRIAIFPYILLLGAWFSRQVLFVLAWLGNAISCLMLRQMEFDADRYETRLVGTTAFAKSTRRLYLLQLASYMGMNDLRRFLDETCLADNLPKVIASNISHITPQVRKALRELQRSQKTGMFHTHPADPERIKNAEKERTEGTWAVPAEIENCPASILFDDFDRICRLSTLEFYQARLGNDFERKRLASTEDLVNERDAEFESRKALNRYFQVRLPIMQPLPLSDNASDTPTKPKEAILRLKNSRESLLKSVSNYRALCRRLQKAESLMLRSGEALACLDCGLNIRACEFCLRSVSSSDVQLTHSRAREGVQNLAASLIEFETNASLRMTIALQLLNVPSIASRLQNVDELTEEVRRLIPEALFISGLISELGTMRILFRRLVKLFSYIDRNDKNQKLHQRIIEESQKLHRRLQGVRIAMKDHEYPFNRDTILLTLVEFALPTIPDSQEYFGTVMLTQKLYQKLAGLQIRLFARLAHAAEQVETVIGLPPLPEPDFDKDE